MSIKIFLTTFVQLRIFSEVCGAFQKPLHSTLVAVVDMVVLLQVSMLFLQWIPWLLCMSRPGDQITFKSILMTQKLKVISRIINIAACVLLILQQDFRV